MLYVTCSLFDDENEAQATAFVARHPDALRETINFDPAIGARGGQLLPSLPGAGHNQDGFFYALISQGLTRARRPAGSVGPAAPRTPVRGAAAWRRLPSARPPLAPRHAPSHPHCRPG